MQPIVLIVPRGSAPAAVDLRRKEAESLRERVQTCEQANAYFKSMQNAAIRESVTKTSADIPGPLRELLDKTPIGHLTPPEITKQGVEMVALCERKPTKIDTPKKREIREKMYAQKYEAKSKAYLQRHPQSRDDRISLMRSWHKPLALTSGEPAGIGPDIALAAWLRRSELDLPPFYLLGDRAFFAERAKILGLKVELADAGPEDASAAFANALPVVATGEIATARPGQPDETSANAALASIRHAVDHVRRRTGRRRRHQPDRQERALPRRIPPSRPYRISRRACGRWRRSAAAGDDAVVAGARRRSRDHPSFAARGARRSSRPT